MSKTPKQIREEQLNVIRETYPQKFGDYVDEMVYYANNVIPVEPMSAKEPLNEEQMELMFNSEDFICEEKKDGTRATLHIREDGNRVFSRRISKKTNWYSENTDSLPHIRDIKVPKELMGTILDGELAIPNGEFKDISSIMNCLWDEAILRQQESDKWVVLNVFDIIYYKGIYVAKMPLYKRKALIKKVVDSIKSEYIRAEEWTYDNVCRTLTKELCEKFLQDKGLQETYPNLFYDIRNNYDGEDIVDIEINKRSWYEYVVLNGGEGLMMKPKDGTYRHTRGREYTKIKKFTTRECILMGRSWYEYVVLNGGEGLMMKPKDGTYRHTRGREYTKIKKFTTRECILMGFNSPTEIYEGKERDTWQYWGMYRQGSLEEIIEGDEPSPYTRDHHVEPLTKHFAKGWIGTILYGVIITAQELKEWQKANPKEKAWVTMYKDRQILIVGECSGVWIGTILYGVIITAQELKEWQKANPKEKAWVTMYKDRQILIVGECSGVDEETREYMTNNQCDLIGKVIELKCHEVLKTGKLRHPRFLRFRDDKEMERCIYKDHMEGN